MRKSFANRLKDIAVEEVWGIGTRSDGMKSKEIDRLVRQHLLPTLPNWEVRRGIMFMKPIGQCLCAVGFSTSSFGADLVYMDAFVRPLFLPPIQGTYSRIKRLKRPGGLRLTGTEEEMRHVLNAIREQAIPFFQVAETPERIASALDESPRFVSRLLTSLRMTKRFAPVTDPYELEAIAMSCVLLQDKDGAKRALARAVQRLVEDGREWCIAMADRLRATNDRLESDFDEFVAELPKWRQENLEARGLAEYQA